MNQEDVARLFLLMERVRQGEADQQLSLKSAELLWGEIQMTSAHVEQLIRSLKQGGAR